VLEAAHALAELHSAGAAHGLIRDQSLAVTLDGTARLLDAGLFRCLGQGPSWLEVREVMGPYFAPEQLLEGRLPDPKTDVYSLGVVLYEGLTGEQVRRGKTFEQQVKLVQSGKLVPPSRLNVAVGPALDEVLQRALAPERSKRYPNAREFAAALSKAAAAFMWRPKMRAEFMNRHFDERRRQDESLRQMLATLPEPIEPEPEPLAVPRARTLVEAAIPAMTMAPLSVAPRRASPRQAPRPSAPRTARKPQPTSRTLAPLVGMLAALLGFVASTGLPRTTGDAQSVLPERSRGAQSRFDPSAPPPAVIVAKPVVLVVEPTEPTELQVERVNSEAPLLISPELASIEPARLAPEEVAPVRKVKRVRRSADEAPIPPWLVKRARR
jgi:serine/threonine-protein kinase